MIQLTEKYVVDEPDMQAVEIIYDPSVTSYESMVKLFFETHNPGEKNRQGPDIGEQYRSAIFYLNDGQKRIAEHLIKILREKGYTIATEVTKAGFFWKAEEKHQQ